MKRGGSGSKTKVADKAARVNGAARHSKNGTGVDAGRPRTAAKKPSEDYVPRTRGTRLAADIHGLRA